MLEPSKVKSAGTQSPDVQFREIDGEFLKQQARIWLEAVLNERFDKETSLADLLDDGEILDRVSTTIHSLLRRHADADGEPVSPKSMFPEASFYGKHSGKYLPYSNVDSFLKACQKLGLTGVDVFSPPDVVEKKDIRRVCLCIRALSKKARARHLEVPEFDYVTHTHSSVSMPTDFVGGLKDSLKQASANNSPSGLRDKETLEKVGLSPLLMKRPPSGLSLVQTESLAPDVYDHVKEPVKSLNFDNGDDTATGAQQSTIDPDTPPVAEGSGFSGGRRGLDLSDDDRGLPPRAFLEDAGKDNAGKDLEKTDSIEPDMPGGSANEADHMEGRRQTLESLERDVDTSEELSEDDNKNKSKKGAWIIPFLSAACTLLGVSLLVKIRDSSIYEVKQGDTLSEISRRVGKLSWQELAVLNPDIENPDLIYPHDRLRLRS